MSSLKYIFLIIIICTLFSCQSKTDSNAEKKNVEIKSTEFIYDHTELSDIKKIENKNNGIQYAKPYRISLSKNYFPDIEHYDFDQPLIYRKDTGNLNTQTSYFFTKKDSTLRLIEYSWSQNRKQQLFIDNLYSFNKNKISKVLGKGIETFEKKENWWQRTVRWDNDSIHVFSFIFGVDEGQRTRVIIRYKKN
ncbi:hypothetical protein [Chryseobacterium sp. JUb7]|uniref:hypothetical protein n=1 Tax=Chryseobacterium sp. JUb7 TaxID=2940599 RepID=UPI002167DC27|nr:hypothetical protein [Chryseobacterium sp. JUb7]MCS3532015.1 hypothetical protein [Chryseobacterium sp. JUb7]